MTPMRVRLIFDSPLPEKPKQCWMLLDNTSCKLIHDLEYLILKKFFDGRGVLELYIDDFLLPSQEKIELIKESDVIRVKELQAMTHNANMPKKNRTENPRKRKLEESNDSIKKYKKIKYSLSKSKGQHPAPQEQSRPSDKDCILSTKTSLKNFGIKSKRKKAAAFLFQNLPSKDSKTESNIQSKTSQISENSSENKKKCPKTLKEKFKKLNPVSKKKPVPVIQNQTQVTENKLTEKLSSTLFPEMKSTGVGNQDKTSLKDDRSCSVVLSSRNYTSSSHDASKTCSSSASSSSSSSSSSLSSGSEDEDKMVLKSKTTCNGPAVSIGNQQDKGLKPGSARQNVESNGEMLMQDQNVVTPKSVQPQHIRFGKDSEDEDIANHVLPPSTNTPTRNDSNEFSQSPIPSLAQQNLNNPKNTESTQNKLGTKRQNKSRKNGQNGCYEKRYTFTSVVAKRIDQNIQDQPTVTEKDFSKCQLLYAPPRVGDTVAYKVLELSKSYTPEISRYKKGKVLTYDPVSSQLKLKLSKESLSRVTGDGNVSYKFEMFDNTDGKDHESEPDEVELQWTSMIEPRLVL